MSAFFMKKMQGFTLFEAILVLLIMGVSLFALCTQFSYMIDEHAERTSNGDSWLISINEQYASRSHLVEIHSFRSVLECKKINKEHRSIGLIRSIHYSAFNSSCESIWNRALSFNHDFGTQDAKIMGYSIFRSFGIERYYPIYSESSNLEYLGGYPASFEYRTLNYDQLNDFNLTLRNAGVQ